MKMQIVRFGGLYAIPSGNGLSRPTAERGEGYRMIGMGELFANDIINDIEMDRVQMSDREKQSFFVEPDDLLFARQSLVAAGAGKCSIVKELEEPTTYESHLIRVRLDKNKCNPWYYYYLFKLPDNPIKAIVNQCAQAGIRGNELVKIKVPLPPRPYQDRIVSVLSTFDNLIEVNNKRIKVLEQMAENLYKEWFVRFRFPGHETTEFDNRIPKGWKYIKLKEISSFQYGKMPSQDHIVDEGYPIYTGYRVSGYYDSFMFDKPMLLVIARGVGGTGEVRISPPEAFITNLSIVFLLNNPDLTKYFLYQLFQIQDLRYLDSGAAQSQITIEDLQRVRILLPDDNLLIQYNKVYLPITNEIQILNEKNINLMKQREMLLPRLMCGKLEV